MGDRTRTLAADEEVNEDQEEQEEPAAASADVVAEALEESADVEVPPPEPTPFEKMLQGMSKEERVAAIARATGGLTDEEKAQLPWNAEENQRKTQEQVRSQRESEAEKRAQAIRVTEGRRDSALSTIRNHITDTMSKLKDGENVLFDDDVLDKSLSEYAAAESSLRNHEFLGSISATIIGLIQEEGEALNDDDLGAIMGRGDGTFESLFEGFMLEYGRRTYERGLEEGRGEAKSSDNEWRKTELAAIRSEVQGGTIDEVEPSTEGGVAAEQVEGMLSDTIEDTGDSVSKIRAGIQKSRRRKSRGKV